MKCLSIQIHQNIDKEFSALDAIRISKSFGRFPEIDKVENDEYVNLNYFTENIVALWKELDEGLLNNPEIGIWMKKISIVVCEGDKGWDDYLLLYHYDKTEQCDVLKK